MSSLRLDGMTLHLTAEVRSWIPEDEAGPSLQTPLPSGVG